MLYATDVNDSDCWDFAGLSRRGVFGAMTARVTVSVRLRSRQEKQLDRPFDGELEVTQSPSGGEKCQSMLSVI